MKPNLLTYICLAVVCAVVGFAAAQQTLENIPVVDFEREVELDEQGLQQFKAFDLTCAVCQGEGVTECLGCKGIELPNCSECKGEKRARCRGCGGTTKTHDPLLNLTCTFCKGSGWYDCPLCGGRGVFTETSTDGGSVEKPCGGCKKVGRFECTPCEGSGVLETIRVRKKSAAEASLKDLKDLREDLAACAKELEPFEPLERPSKSTKALETMLQKPSKKVPQLKDMLALLEEVQKNLARMGANYTNYNERQVFEYLTFRNRSVHLLRHDLRVLDVCLKRAEFNDNVAKSKK